MSNAAGRNRKRDNAERLGAVQTRVQETLSKLNRWIDTTQGQLSLIGVALVLGLLASLITP
jgi:hypothetical protein